MTKLSLKVYSGSDVYRTHAEAWENLLERAGQPSFFLRSTWLDTWASAQSSEGCNYLLVAERDGTWVAGAPLFLGLGLLGARRQVRLLEFAGAEWFDRMEIPAVSYGDLLETLRLASQWVRQELKDWVAISLNELPVGCMTIRALEELARDESFRVYWRLMSKAPMVVLDEGGKVSERYARKLRSSKRKLDGMGRPDCSFFLPESQQVAALLDEIGEVEQASWKGEQGVGVFREGLPHKLFQSLWQRLARTGELALATLRLDGRLLAYHWGFRHRGRFLAYNLAQLPEADGVCGGLLLLDHMVHHGHELGFDMIDASRGSLETPNFIGAYHGPVRLHANATIYNCNLPGGTMRFLRHVVFPAARAVLGRSQPPTLPDSTT